ncbi:MAG: hypothetical protein K0M56_02190 [Kaistella sp.]|nr:hypothetical protein [Kaistella sp.]
MKMVAVIVEHVDPKDNFIIVEFKKDPTKQHFIVYIDEPWQKRMRKYDSYILTVKWRSIVMDDISGNKTYDTQLFTDAHPVPGEELFDKRRMRN